MNCTRTARSETGKIVGKTGGLERSNLEDPTGSPCRLAGGAVVKKITRTGGRDQHLVIAKPHDQNR